MVNNSISKVMGRRTGYSGRGILTSQRQSAKHSLSEGFLALVTMILFIWLEFMASSAARRMWEKRIHEKRKDQCCGLEHKAQGIFWRRQRKKEQCRPMARNARQLLTRERSMKNVK